MRIEKRQTHIVFGLIAACVLAISYVFTWSTAYSYGRSDGISRVFCIQNANAQYMQGMTESQRMDYIESTPDFPQCK